MVCGLTSSHFVQTLEWIAEAKMASMALSSDALGGQAWLNLHGAVLATFPSVVQESIVLGLNEHCKILYLWL